jgi:hypothetical protein
MRKNRTQRLALAGAFTVLGLNAANAQTDITGVITAANGYTTAAIALGIIILLFVIGRGIVRKIAK